MTLVDNHSGSPPNLLKLSIPRVVHTAGFLVVEDSASSSRMSDSQVVMMLSKSFVYSAVVEVHPFNVTDVVDAVRNSE